MSRLLFQSANYQMRENNLEISLVAISKLPNEHPEKCHENGDATHAAAPKEVGITQRGTAAHENN